MISAQQALDMLRRYGVDDQRIEHSRGVAGLAHDYAVKIARRHPELGVDPEKVRIAGLLHDIGRSRPGDHETNSVDILTTEGLPEIAQIVMHGTLFEASVLRGKTDPGLLPHSVENKIVAYADARFRLSPVTLDERFAEIKRRRSGEKEKVRAIEDARERFHLLERELMELMQ